MVFLKYIRIENLLLQVDKKENGARYEDPGLKMEFFYSVNDAVDEMVILVNIKCDKNFYTIKQNR